MAYAFLQLSGVRWRNRLPAPVDKVGRGRFTPRGFDERGDLAAMIKRVTKELGQDVSDHAPEPAGIEALVLECAIERGSVRPSRYVLQPSSMVLRLPARSSSVTPDGNKLAGARSRRQTGTATFAGPR